MASLYPQSNSNTPPSKNDMGFPSPLDLFNALESILWFWPDLFIHSAQNDELLLAPLTLMRTVRLTGTHEGMVAFRTTPELGVLLAQKLLYPERTETLAQDAFSEFVNMFCGYLMAKIREKDKGSFRHFLPQDLPVEFWPRETPNATLVVGIQDHLLEIRLWLTLAAPLTRAGKP